jgi:excisionase family DNA binding protein
LQDFAMMKLLTTAECAAYLRLKERSLYELAARRQIPCTRATGKLLFPLHLLDRWLEARTEGSQDPGVASPLIYAGSSDPLLDWALRESGAGLAVLASGSLAGLGQLAAGGARLAGLHLPPIDAADALTPDDGAAAVDPASSGNVAALRAALPFADVVAIRWAVRGQGLLVAPGNPRGLAEATDLLEPGLRCAIRPPDSGSGVLLSRLLEASGATAVPTDPTLLARTEADLAALVADGRADCGLGIEAVARRFGTGFVPLATEAFDLVMRRRDYFEAPLQRLVAFARSTVFAAEAERLGGYDLESAGRVAWNG